MATITGLPRGEFLKALTAVLPHCGRKSDVEYQGRLRVYGTGEGLFIYATDSYTSGVVHIGCVEFVDGELPTFDLETNIVKLILGFFVPPSGRTAREQWLDAPLRFEISDTYVTIIADDVLLDGESITLPTATVERFPGLIAFLPDGPEPSLRDDWSFDRCAPRICSPRLYARFAAAAKAYAEPVIIGRRKGGFDVQVGASFVGRIAVTPLGSARDDGRALEEYHAKVENWEKYRYFLSTNTFDLRAAYGQIEVEVGDTAASEDVSDDEPEVSLLDDSDEAEA